ncbi:MAG: transcription antitermination factor NusB [Ruminobacter sp.]|uniref:Transcription antitermination protein NusB n=1 Tax=Ruminobacter amylophilus TaxID=867 RepID=A0A662ZKW3_9GAMM|nr:MULTISPECIES: transcription antitermination factor NusB [Ruminobacter]MBQ3774879.1 transcription antitermination factor NusB [Ruminobacter sp.]SFP68212.1 NusB antitermination factor [Ruminobacter amylophilus]
MNPGQRHRARHFAMQALYQWEITKELASVIEEQFLEDQPVDDKTDKEYLHQLIVGTITHVDEIDKTYKPYLNSRSIEDLDMVDKSILRLATYELLFQSKDVPYRVIINEAILLAKDFAAQDSHKFVNGVLDKVVKNMQLQETEKQ